jgi:hypothetical protein
MIIKKLKSPQFSPLPLSQLPFSAFLELFPNDQIHSYALMATCEHCKTHIHNGILCPTSQVFSCIQNIFSCSSGLACLASLLLLPFLPLVTRLALPPVSGIPM